MRLFEITDPDPRYARLASEVADVYRSLYQDVFHALKKFPPRGAVVDERRRAVVFPYHELTGDDEHPSSPTFQRVLEVLERLGWTTDKVHYREGIATRNEEYIVPDTPRVRRTGGKPGERILRTKKMSIARILEQAANDANARTATGLDAEGLRNLSKEFQNDPLRRGVSTGRRGGSHVLVVSFDPMEAAHASTRRGWTSCWQLDDGGKGEFLEALRCGIATAWLTTAEDVEGKRWIDRPTARWLVVPYVDEGGRTVALRAVVDDYHVYGTPPPGADRAVREAVDRIEESIRRAIGPRSGTIAVRSLGTEMPERTASGGVADPAWLLHVLVSTQIENWPVEIRGWKLPALRREEIAEIAERAVMLGSSREAVHEVVAAVTSGRKPRSESARAAVLALAVFGLAPARAVPPPESYGDLMCPILRAVAAAGGPDPKHAIARIWKGAKHRAAAVIAYFDGCHPMPDDDLLPDRDEAIAVARRIVKAGATKDRAYTDIVRILRSGGREGTDAPEEVRELARKILAAGREGSFTAMDAVFSPDEVLAAPVETVPPEIRLVAILTRMLAKPLLDIDGFGREIARLTERRGRDAVIAALQTIVDVARTMRPVPRWIRRARTLLATMGSGKPPRDVDWRIVEAARQAGIVGEEDVLALAVETGVADRDIEKTGRYEAGFPAVVGVAMLLAGRLGLDEVRNLAAFHGREGIVAALRTIAEHGPSDLAGRARRMLGIAEGGGRVRPGGEDAWIAALLAVAGVLPADALAGALNGKQWNELAHAARKELPDVRERVADVLARTAPPFEALVGVWGTIVAPVAERMVRHGVEPRWDDVRPKDLEDPRYASAYATFTGMYARAGGKVPDDLPAPPLVAIAAAVRDGLPVDRPPASRWIRSYARDLARSVEKGRTDALDELVELVDIRSIRGNLLGAILKALPRRIAEDVHEYMQNKLRFVKLPSGDVFRKHS